MILSNGPDGVREELCLIEMALLSAYMREGSDPSCLQSSLTQNHMQNHSTGPQSQPGLKPFPGNSSCSSHLWGSVCIEHIPHNPLEINMLTKDIQCQTAIWTAPFSPHSLHQCESFAAMSCLLTPHAFEHHDQISPEASPIKIFTNSPMDLCQWISLTLPFCLELFTALESVQMNWIDYTWNVQRVFGGNVGTNSAYIYWRLNELQAIWLKHKIIAGVSTVWMWVRYFPERENQEPGLTFTIKGLH